jgi:hypothetical protein
MVTDVHDSDYTRLIVDPVDDPVGSEPRAELVIQGRQQSLADAVQLL